MRRELSSKYILVISDRQALAWILREQRMAFAESRSQRARELKPGDQLILYTTRRCFGNPVHDRGRIIGSASIKTKVSHLKEPVSFKTQSYPLGCSLSIDTIANFREGPEIADLVEQLKTFPASWAVHIRRALVPIDDHD